MELTFSDGRRARSKNDGVGRSEEDQHEIQEMIHQTPAEMEVPKSPTNFPTDEPSEHEQTAQVRQEEVPHRRSTRQCRPVERFQAAYKKLFL